MSPSTHPLARHTGPWALSWRGLWSLVLLLVLGVAPEPVTALPPAEAVDLAVEAESVALTDSLQVLKQPPGHVSSHQTVLQQPGWLPATPERRNSSMVPNAVWLTGLVHNSSTAPVTRWIVVKPWRIKEVHLHVLRPDGLTELDHQRSGKAMPMAARTVYSVDPAFPVTVPPGETLRLLVRAQDITIPTTSIEAWSPDAYHHRMAQTLVGEAITITTCLVLLFMLLWTADAAFILLAGWLLMATVFEASFQGQLLPYFLPSLIDRLVPVFLIAGVLSYLMFTLASRALLDIGRRGVWAWILGGINALALLAASLSLFTGDSLLARQIVNAIGPLLIAAWALATWQTRLPDRPGAHMLRYAFVACAVTIALTAWHARTGQRAPYAAVTIVCILVVYNRARNMELQIERQRTRHLAFHDALTQLPNRVHGRGLLQEALQAARHRGESVGLLYLDLDKFKHVNDTHGHAVGDVLLQTVATRLKHQLDSAGTACRLSGDEFMAILPGVQTQQAVERQCEAILAQFAHPFDIEGRRLFVTISIGAALCPTHADTAEALMRHADTALFEAKRAGENRFRVFHPDMNAHLMALLSTRSALHLALERQEFELHYQPQVGLRRGELVGVEALLRWRRPGQHDLNQPGDFIAVAEESGLIVPIGRWVLQEACRQAALWRQTGWPALKMAVNVSPVQFQSGTLVQDVMAALTAHALPAACLELELTESVLIGNEDEALRTIGQLKALGVSLSIDDFGTGYSSLSYLHRFRFDRIKIDRSFIVRLGQHADAQAIVHAIVQMARHLGLRTTAEGVENAEAVEQLTDIGCDEVQGFHYAQPLPAAMLDPWRAAFQPAPALG